MNCLSEFALDDLAIHGPPQDGGGGGGGGGGGLGPVAAAAGHPAAAHLAGCARCQARLADREIAKAAFVPTSPALWRGVATARATTRARPRWGLSLWGIPAVTVAGAFAVLFAFWTPSSRPSPSSVASLPYVGPKGAEAAFTLEIAARRDGHVFTVDGHRVVRAGDELRFIPLPVGPPSNVRRYIAIASVDGAGTFSLFYPSSPDGSSVPLPPAGEALPGSIVLDDAPGPERLLVVLSATPIPARSIRAAAREDHDALRGWAGAQTFWIELRKERPGVPPPPGGR